MFLQKLGIQVELGFILSILRLFSDMKQTMTEVSASI